MFVSIKGLCESYRSDLRLLEWMVSMECLQHFLRSRRSDKDANMYWGTDWPNRWVQRLFEVGKEHLLSFLDFVIRFDHVAKEEKR